MDKLEFPINIELNKDFVECAKELFNSYGNDSEELRKLNGMSKCQLNYSDFIDSFVDKPTIADASIDGNANVRHKDIVSLDSEMSKPHSKLQCFSKLFYEIEKKYGLDTAREWLKNEWDGHFYMHDAYSCTKKPYCWAADVKSVAERGLYFIGDGFNAEPPKHLVTFTDFVVEMVSYLTNRQAGAVGLPSYLVWSFYFWHKDVENGYYIKSPEYYRDQEAQRIIYKLNQPYVKSGVESAFTNFNIFDRPYFEALFGGLEFPDGTYAIDYEEEFMEYQKSFMRVVSAVRSANVLTYPVLSYSLLRVNGKFVDEEFAKWACKHNMKWADSNFYISDSVDSLSSCCRLRNAIKGDDTPYFNSIGGTALNVGSVKVNTINLARLAYENATTEDYLNALKGKVTLCLKVLDRQRHAIERNIEKGLLPNYTCGLVDLSKQYSTVGINGLYEAIEHYGYTYQDEFGYTYYTDEGLKFGQDILKTIHDEIDSFKKNERVSYMMNLEQIPGERAAAILMEKDQLFYPNEKYSLPLYGNQWIPLGTKTTLQERVKVCGIMDKACNGGSILHANIDSPFTDFNAAWKMLNYIADQGVTYFAFCTRISACENNHGFYGDTCPICGKPVQTTYQRVVGFLTPVSSYSKERKAEFKKRDWMDLNAMEDLQ